MAEDEKKTGAEEKNEQVTEEQKQETKTPDDESSTSQKTTEEQKTQEQQTDQKVQVPVQERINRMYARLQIEKDKRNKAETELAATKKIQPDAETEDEPKPGLTESDVKAIMQREKREEAFLSSERGVLTRHPNALTEDGQFNMQDPFVREYIEIGRKNPHLALMENGPELAEAMAEKKLGIDYKKGRVDEATDRQTKDNAYTAASTTAPKKTSDAAKKLTPEELKVAARMRLTPEQYAANKERKPVE